MFAVWESLVVKEILLLDYRGIDVNGLMGLFERAVSSTERFGGHPCLLIDQDTKSLFWERIKTCSELRFMQISRDGVQPLQQLASLSLQQIYQDHLDDSAGVTHLRIFGTTAPLRAPLPNENFTTPEYALLLERIGASPNGVLSLTLL